MDKRNSSVPRKSMSIKIISMGNTEVGKVRRLHISFTCFSTIDSQFLL